ncbi:hypothetical protein PR048_000111 [Dryococelus australis]|uniref:Uncharacterized protein n=1 Tax=Dryococelus australis TaxID=614101 RepID=A0ABQ9IEW4_9NEOP|nr:hypothetical protein PR048_000111 [Dryococelus australis]
MSSALKGAAVVLVARALASNKCSISGRVAPRIFARGDRDGRCRWSQGFLWAILYLSPLHSGATPFTPRATLIGSQDSHASFLGQDLKGFTGGQKQWDSIRKSLALSIVHDDENYDNGCSYRRPRLTRKYDPAVFCISFCGTCRYGKGALTSHELASTVVENAALSSPGVKITRTGEEVSYSGTVVLNMSLCTPGVKLIRTGEEASRAGVKLTRTDDEVPHVGYPGGRVGVGFVYSGCEVNWNRRSGLPEGGGVGVTLRYERWPVAPGGGRRGVVPAVGVGVVRGRWQRWSRAAPAVPVVRTGPVVVHLGHNVWLDDADCEARAGSGVVVALEELAQADGSRHEEGCEPRPQALEGHQQDGGQQNRHHHEGLEGVEDTVVVWAFSWGSPVAYPVFIPLRLHRYSILLLAEATRLYPDALHLRSRELTSERMKRFGRLLTSRFGEPMRVIYMSMEQHRNERAGETGDPEKTRWPAASSGMIPTCENPELPGRGLNPDRLEASSEHCALSGINFLYDKLFHRKITLTVVIRNHPSIHLERFRETTESNEARKADPTQLLQIQVRSFRTEPSARLRTIFELKEGKGGRVISPGASLTLFPAGREGGRFLLIAGSSRRRHVRHVTPAPSGAVGLLPGRGKWHGPWLPPRRKLHPSPAPARALLLGVSPAKTMGGGGGDQNNGRPFSPPRRPTNYTAAPASNPRLQPDSQVQQRAQGPETPVLRYQASGLARVLSTHLVTLQDITGVGADCHSPPGLSLRRGISPELLQHTELTTTSTIQTSSDRYIGEVRTDRLVIPLVFYGTRWLSITDHSTRAQRQANRGIPHTPPSPPSPCPEPPIGTLCLTAPYAHCRLVARPSSHPGPPPPGDRGCVCDERGAVDFPGSAMAGEVRTERHRNERARERGDPREKPADQRYLPARCPRARMLERLLRELNLVRLGRVVSSPYKEREACRAGGGTPRGCLSRLSKYVR